MPSTIALVALHAAAQASSPPPQSGGMVSNSAPPPVVRVNVPPPPAIVYSAPPVPPAPPYYPRESPAMPPVLLEVRVSGEEGAIWNGTLRVGPSASYSENRSESRAAHCPTHLAYEQALRNSLTLNLSRYGSREKPDQFGVVVSWSRPANPRGCGEPGSRSVQLHQVIELPPGAEGVVRGDGGLAVHLKRR